MKLSVVIPVYNGENFIKKSYNSIIGQDLDDFEIIYVNNNSNDNTDQEIEKLCNIDQRVKMFLQNTQGTAHARNLGIENAIGDYIYVFDVDDEIYPNALRNMITVLDQDKNLDAVFGKMVKSSKGISETNKPADETLNVFKYDKPYWGIKWFEDLKNVVGPPAFLYRKSVFNSIGNYNVELRVCEDTAFDIRLGMTSNVAFLDMYVYLYFKHNSSTIQQSKQNEDQIFILWSRLVKSHLPFYLDHKVPLRYRELLFRQLFSAMGKLIARTQGYRNRQLMAKKVLDDISHIKVPFVIKSYLKILMVLPLNILLKIYVYKVAQYYAQSYMKKDANELVI